MKIALGDLRHRTLGRHSVLMPLGIGLIASYLKKNMQKEVDIRLYEDPTKLLREINIWKPNIIGLSNYMWNAELNRLIFSYAKQHLRDVVCVAGGPEFPVDMEECKDFLTKRPEIDFYCFLEGEIAFTKLVEKIYYGISCGNLKGIPLVGMLSIHPEDKTLAAGEFSRITNLDTIPSPYLSGIMDQWFEGNYVPSIQTARGCPFTCAYCRASNRFYSRVYMFDLERVMNELTYIAKRMVSLPVDGLYILDSNFGLFERDELIAQHIGKLQDKYDWPNSIMADTSKDNYPRVLRMAEEMRNAMQPLCSVQTRNSQTLRVIKRSNLPREEYKEAQSQLIKRGITPATELIVPMPHETLDSFIDGLKEIIGAGVENITTFTWMLLPGTKLASRESRERFKIKSRFRIIPRQFGEYERQKCFEIEEVCCETSSMSIQEYIRCRGFAFLCFLFARSQYDILQKHLSDFSLNIFDLIKSIFDKIDKTQSIFSKLYQDLLKETYDELFFTKKEVYQFYVKQDNYNKLLRGEIGDNLFRKYLSIVLCNGVSSLVDMAYDSLIDLINTEDLDVRSSLDDAKKWFLSVGNISEMFYDEEIIFKESKEIKLSYDVLRWYNGFESNMPLDKYKRENTLCLYYEKKEYLFSLMTSFKNLYGEDPYFRIGKALVDHNPHEFWISSKYKI